MKILPLPPLEFLEEYFKVDKTSPSGLRWKKLQAPCQKKPGDVAGGHSHKGYWKVSITYKGVKYSLRTHRIVVFLKTKIDPEQNQVDHIIGKSDNTEVRTATPSQNGANSKKWNKKTSSIYKGVYWNTGCNKWLAKIGVNRKRIHLGVFACEKEAAKAYNRAAIKYFGEFARLNNIED
jgi:hypothetical protein